MEVTYTNTRCENRTFRQYTTSRSAHWDDVARQLDEGKKPGVTYRRQLERVYRHIIPKKSRVLEIGCAQGDLLAAVDPARGVGIDFSTEMLSRTRERHGHLTFVLGDAHSFAISEEFDYIILSDLMNDLWDVQTVLERVREVCAPRGRILINTYSRLWEGPLRAARKVGLATPLLRQNWLTVQDLEGLCNLSGLEVVRSWSEILMPIKIPILTGIANRYLAKIWPLRHLALTNFVIARLEPDRQHQSPLVSVVVPARNEAGNIASILERMPEMGRGTEIIFVEGHSTDGTFKTILREIEAIPHRTCHALQQRGRGKGDAVRLGFSHASGEVLMILDADMTVPPEDLPRFYEALISGKADFVNGVRLVYPMEKRAMRFANLVGNKFFSLAFTWLLGQPLKDTLCGTKVLWKVDYERIAENRHYFGNFDPFGDFDLLFGAAKLSLKIHDLPVRYRERIYGDTNIERWRHGAILFRMVVFAARRLKFV